VDASVVRSAWERLLPGLLEQYDSDKSLPCICPRPLFIVNGAADPRCPVAGLVKPLKACRQAYRLMGKPGNFGVHIEGGVGHVVKERMDCLVEEFFVAALKPQGWQHTLHAWKCSPNGKGNGLLRRGRDLQPWYSRLGRLFVGDRMCDDAVQSCIPREACWECALAGQRGFGREDADEIVDEKWGRRPSHHVYQGTGDVCVTPVYLRFSGD
jgi:hypothetical protein